VTLEVADVAEAEILPDRLHIDVVLVGDCDQVSAVRELGTCYFLHCILSDHLDALGLQHLELHLGHEADHDVEPVGMLAEVDRFVFEETDLLEFQQLLVVDAQCPISREGSNVLLAHAHINTSDAVRVEGLDDLFELCFVLLSLHLGHVQIDELSVAADEGHLVLFGGYTHMFQAIVSLVVTQKVALNAKGCPREKAHVPCVLVVDLDHGVLSNHHQTLALHLHGLQGVLHG